MVSGAQTAGEAAMGAVSTGEAEDAAVPSELAAVPATAHISGPIRRTPYRVKNGTQPWSPVQ